ncbi:phenylacetate--CoA ligase family protein [Streptomyces sp. CBMA152]|uniref:phenylacetate--CoA ligase family protein n=1 Tax=Streptomyces sp. CBMA152 TaxID=1896312 RepID=UPI0016602BFD|nr:phenylacetate--CoA ligase family protein [Streptomyces sp. CBMA152]MBD0742393.1 AMP-dependent synthetase [Streptomyces sp. CBMA152]
MTTPIRSAAQAQTADTTPHYPTDLLLAVAHVEQTLAREPGSPAARALADAGVDFLFRTEELTEGLDELFGGVCQYPWQPLTDSNDVIAFSPLGTVVLDDAAPDTTEKPLRGLLLAWAAGNDVIVRTARPNWWRTLDNLMRAPGFPLPALLTVEPGAPCPGAHHIDVPPLPPVRGQLRDAALDARRFRLDCTSGWAQSLSRREYLPGTALAQARATDSAWQDARIAARLRYLVERARRTSYYRGLSLPQVADRSDLQHLPILEKSALERHSLPAGRELCSGDRPSGEVLRSGATSGDPRYIVFSRADWTNMVREAIPVLYALGLRPGDRVINTLFGGELYGGMVTSQNELSRMPLETYTVGGVATADHVLMLVRSFEANVVLGMPALLLPVLRNAKAACPDLRIEKVLYGGSPMMESDKQWLRDELGTRIVASVLAANDGAQLGYQCSEMSGTRHHVCDDYNLLEVVDEQGRPLPDGEFGELLVTSMQKFEGPLIRYRIGDVGRIYEHSCGCGLTGRVLDYLGRSDGLIKARSQTMLYADVVAELAPFGVSQVQIEVASHDRVESVVIRTESSRPLDPEALRAHLESTFELLGTRQEFESDEVLFRFVVECHGEGELPRHPVSGKVRTVIDRRLEP